MIPVPLHHRRQMPVVIGPEGRIAPTVTVGITPNSRLLHHKQPLFVGDFVPPFIPGLRVEAHGFVVAGLDIMNHLADLRLGQIRLRGPERCRQQVDRYAVQIKQIGFCPELTEAKTRGVRFR